MSESERFRYNRSNALAVRVVRVHMARVGVQLGMNMPRVKMTMWVRWQVGLMRRGVIMCVEMCVCVRGTSLRMRCCVL